MEWINAKHKNPEIGQRIVGKADVYSEEDDSIKLKDILFFCVYQGSWYTPEIGRFTADVLEKITGNACNYTVTEWILDDDYFSYLHTK